MSDYNKVHHGLGQVCSHGGLERVCRICEIESALAAMTAERDRLQNLVEDQAKAIEFSKNHIERLEGKTGFCAQCETYARRAERMEKALNEYGDHRRVCILTFWEAGEPTPDGGYRTKYKGRWYQSKPVNEEPKCNCGFDESLDDGKGVA